jgi:hypothetical protein
MTPKFTPINPTTRNNLNLYKSLSDSIFINKDKLYCFDGKYYDKDTRSKLWSEFEKKHFRCVEELDDELSPNLINLNSKKFVKLIEKFNNPEFRINKNKIEIREEGNSRTRELFSDYKTHHKDKSEIKLPPLKEIKEPEYQTNVSVNKIRNLKRYIEITSRKKGIFVKGNPTKIKIIFTKENRKQLIRVEDRNDGIVTYHEDIKAESIKRNFEYILTYKLFRLLPDDNYMVQMSCKDYLSEWFCSKRSIKFSLDIVKVSYAKN